MCRFNESLFNDYEWLEYSITKDAAFCLYCYLFKTNVRAQGGGDAFVVEGFTNWKKTEKLRAHIGGVNSAHNEAYGNGQVLLKQKQHIESFLARQTDEPQIEYWIRLNASLDCIRFLLRQGLGFRGRDELEESNNQGNFLELLRYTAEHNEDIKKVVLRNVQENLKLIAPDIQKDIVNAAAVKTLNVILKDIGDELFAVMIDESRDISIKEQMAVVIRYVDKSGCLIERFLGVMHVLETTAVSLKTALEALFSKYGLNIMRLRGLGYDGASNMQGGSNGLKELILKENESAFYIHCFTHQFQLALVHVAKNHNQIALLFSQVATVVNIVGASCKHRDSLRQKQTTRILELGESGELLTGQGLNQETNLKRSGDTHWGSHYGTLVNLIIMFPSVIDVLEMVLQDSQNPEQKAVAFASLDSMQSFNYILSLHLMKNVLGITNDLSKALKRKDQDIVNDMGLVKVCKQRLQMMRDDGWDALMMDVSLFCVKHSVDVPNMEGAFVPRGRARRRAVPQTNLHHYKIDLAYTVVDLQFAVLNDRFDEVNTELLLCITCLNPSDSFSAFNKEKLICLTQFYPTDFSEMDLMTLQDQLENYIFNVRSDDEFSAVIGISELAKKMVDTKKDLTYPLVYLLIKLSLILRNRLRNRIGDEWLNDSLITYIERDIFDTIDSETIMQRFQNMKTRRGQL